MRDQYSSTLRIISTIVLSFFTWSFGGVFDIAYAIENSRESGVNSQESSKAAKTPAYPSVATDSQSSRGKRAEEKFGKDIEEIANILKDDRSDHETKRQKIKGKKAEIDADDVEIKKQFRDTEDKIKDLPEVIKKRHRDFVKKYDDNLRELRTNLDDIDRAKSDREKDLAQRKAREFVDKVKPPKKHQALDPNKLPHRTEEPVFKEPRTRPEEFQRDSDQQLARVGSPRRRVDPTFSSQPNSPNPSLVERGMNPSFPLVGNLSEKGLRASRSDTGAKPILVASNGSLSGLLSPNSQFTNNDSRFTALRDFPEGSYQIALANPPTSADLAETIEVKFTPEIRQLAEDLEYNPTKIFNFVRNYIDFVPTYGSIQGAQRTLLTGKGNAFDQASLLIALLRVSGIAAKYEYGTVQVDIDKIKNMLGGFTDSMAALRLMASGGIPVKGLVEGGTIKAVQFENIWVTAWIDYIPSRGAVHKQGDTWIPLDPSFKQDTFTPGVDFAVAVPFDTQSYLNEIQSTAIVDETTGSITGVNTDLAQTRVNDYGAQVEAYLNGNYPNATEEHILRNGEIIRKELPFLPLNLPYAVVAKGWEAPALPSNLRHKLIFSVVKDVYDQAAETSLNFTVNLSEIAGKRVTISYAPATDADKSTIRSLMPKPHADGSPIQISEIPSSFPSYLINLKPELRIGGQLMATGVAANMGFSEQLSITLQSPSKSVRAVDKELVAGEHYAIGLDVMPLEEDAIEEKILNHYDLLEQVKIKTVYPSKDDLYGEFLHTMAVGYFDQADAFEQRLSKMMGIVSHRLPSIGIVQSSLHVRYVFGFPYTVSAEGLALDIQYSASMTFALDGNNESVKTFNFVSGLYESGLEHAVPEQLFSTTTNPVDGVSTVKILSVANSQNIPIYTITAANIAAILPKIQTGINAEILSAVNAGKEVITPERNVTINGWTGTGYIVYDPANGNGAFMISGGKNGGFLTALGAYWIACGTVIYDSDPLGGMEEIMAGVNLITEAQDLWARVLKTAGKVALEMASWLPWGKVLGSLSMAMGAMLPAVTKAITKGHRFESFIVKSVLHLEKTVDAELLIKYRTIPDSIIYDAFMNPRILWEIKSGKEVFLSSGNIQKLLRVATEKGIPLNLVVRDATYVAPGVKDAIQKVGGTIFKFIEQTGEMVPL
jgi:transglutaminase-like putative cysteine protease